MTIQTILVYPEYKKELRGKSEMVRQINPKVRRIIRDLKDTLQAHEEGVGLAHRKSIFIKEWLSFVWVLWRRVNGKPALHAR